MSIPKFWSVTKNLIWYEMCRSNSQPIFEVGVCIKSHSKFYSMVAITAHQLQMMQLNRSACSSPQHHNAKQQTISQHISNFSSNDSITAAQELHIINNSMLHSVVLHAMQSNTVFLLLLLLKHNNDKLHSCYWKCFHIFLHHYKWQHGRIIFFKFHIQMP